MTFLLKYVWTAKVCLTGWNTYKVCVGENPNEFICIVSLSYFFILFLASIVSCKRLPTPRQIESQEEEYLQQLEEGFGMRAANTKQE